MRILKDIKNPDFWAKAFQLAFIFFIIFVGISLLISHFQKIISGNFDAIYEEEWANGQWVNYFLIKAAISVVYAIYMTSRRRNFSNS
jgi:divalent metal cation (Fe/Co/Zn/Cd) transporter